MSVRFRLLALALHTLLSGCARAPDPIIAPGPSLECLFGDAQLTGTDTVTVALTQAVDPEHAPRPHHDGERFLFRQIYDGLVRVDCHGRVHPAIARNWTSRDGNREWEFTLDPNARFWDGRAVTAADVLASWRRVWRDVAQNLPKGDYFDSVTARVSNRVVIRLDAPDATLPAAVALPALAVIGSNINGTPWPLGTGEFTIADDRGVNHVTIIPRRGNGEQSGIPAVRFLTGGRSDARDIIDTGVDAVIAWDLETIQYASTVPGFRIVALPWERTHALIIPARQTVTRSTVDPGDIDSVRAGLARGPVRVAARPAEAPYRSTAVGECTLVAEGAARHTGRSATGGGQIVYRRDDRVARALAERLVALLSRRDRPEVLATLLGSAADQPAALPMETEAFDESLRLGRHSAYVLGWSRRSLETCESLWPRAATVVPLIDSRPSLIHRGTIWGSYDWDGVLRLFAPTPPRRR